MSHPLDAEKESRAIKRSMRGLPHHYQGLDSNRMTLLYFLTASLHLFDPSCEDHESIVEWVYAQQIGLEEGGGFCCGPSINAVQYRESHIAMTYNALSILLLSGDDLSRIDRQGVLLHISQCSLPDGSFQCLSRPSESDVRFVFCACAISSMLGDWSSLDKPSVIGNLLRCQSFDGGFGMGPGQEGHGGSTYCAVASLALLGALEQIRNKELLVRWCLDRQGHGFQGRPNKPEDSCYSFWIGATLHILGASSWTSPKPNREFNMKCHSSQSGFSKVPGVYPDIMHSYLGSAGLSLMGLDDLTPMNTLWAIPGLPCDSVGVPHVQEFLQ